MKKIMFNDKYGLTEEVLLGRKTQTRRIITCPKTYKGQDVRGFNVYIRKSDGAMIEWPKMYDADEREFEGGYILPKYKVGEVVAVAQSYKDIACGALWDDLKEAYRTEPTKLAGWTNKMFVRADQMPHQIRITNVRIERLQDISSPDCLAEGVMDERLYKNNNPFGFYFCNTKLASIFFKTPQEAYAWLVNKVCKRGTWERNPWVWVFEFELVK